MLCPGHAKGVRLLVPDPGLLVEGYKDQKYHLHPPQR